MTAAFDKIKPSTNTQATAWEKLSREVTLKTTPEDAQNDQNGTLDDGVDIGTAPFAEPKADSIETKLEQADGTTHLREDPASTAVTSPEAAPQAEPTESEAAALAANQRAEQDQAIADQAYDLEEPNAPQL